MINLDWVCIDYSHNETIQTGLEHEGEGLRKIQILNLEQIKPNVTKKV